MFSPTEASRPVTQISTCFYVSLIFKAPPPFKLRKSPKRNIEAKSPFSTNRSYNLPTGKAFTVKKSEKALTQFKDFRNVDVAWKVRFMSPFHTRQFTKVLVNIKHSNKVT